MLSLVFTSDASISTSNIRKLSSVFIILFGQNTLIINDRLMRLRTYDCVARENQAFYGLGLPQVFNFLNTGEISSNTSQ